MCYKMIPRGENTPNQGILMPFRTFFTSKTSIFRPEVANNPLPPVTYFETVLHPYLLKIFNAVFAMIRRKDEINISRKKFYAAPSRFFFGEKKP